MTVIKMLEDYKFSVRKFVTVFCLGTIAIFAFLLLWGSNLRGTGTPIEYADFFFYFFYALLLIASVAFSIEKK